MIAKPRFNYDKSRVPVYLQVASVVRQRIEAGRWKVGEKIPTIEEFEREFGVAHITIRRAIDLLREEGLVDAQRGRGTFVRGQSEEKYWFNLANDLESIVESASQNVLKVVHVEQDVPSPPLGQGEGIAADAYTRIRSVQFHGDEPFAVVNLCLAKEIFVRDRRRFQKKPALPLLMQMSDINIAQALQTVAIGVAGPETSELLNIGLGEPTADCRLVLLNDENVAIYVAEFHYHRNCFILRRDLLEGKRAKSELGRANKVVHRNFIST
jgi:GntR family transcriptional regulator